ncbi:MAG: diaminopimelate decarboxylase [Bacteroidia bacterium]|nr:diaminopimelate decarboxylase [Bacteroidia bacterium]
MSLQKHIPSFKKQKTPFWFYDMSMLGETLQRVARAAKAHNFEVHYALKANSNIPILKKIRAAGLGADCVSGNEVKRAVECGFNTERIVFAGVGKSDGEIRYALSKNIFCFNCESAQEIGVIQSIAAKMKKTARIALRINPNVNANTHRYITTGLEENKFGINLWELDEVMETVLKCRNIDLTGIHFHIGSQISDLEPFRSLCLRVNEIQEWFISRRILLKEINVGGGLGVDYHHPDANGKIDFESFFKLFHRFIELRPGQRLHFELGRSIVASCGSLISKVLYVKKGVNTNFAILDAGMTELIRPALYQSYHTIQNLSAKGRRGEERYDVVGPICESSDCFAKALILPEIRRGDLIAIRTTGAYGEVMSSGYNLRDKAKAVYK